MNVYNFFALCQDLAKREQGYGHQPITEEELEFQERVESNHSLEVSVQVKSPWCLEEPYPYNQTWDPDTRTLSKVLLSEKILDPIV